MYGYCQQGPTVYTHFLLVLPQGFPHFSQASVNWYLIPSLSFWAHISYIRLHAHYLKRSIFVANSVSWDCFLSIYHSHMTQNSPKAFGHNQFQQFTQIFLMDSFEVWNCSQSLFYTNCARDTQFNIPTASTMSTWNFLSYLIIVPATWNTFCQNKFFNPA
jgi:hypothetical protein